MDENTRRSKEDLFEKKLISGRVVHIMQHGADGPVIYWGVGAGPDIEAECRRVFKEVCKQCPDCAFLLVAFEAADWNHDYTPWAAPAVFGDAAFTGGALETLHWLTGQCIPAVENRLDMQKTLQKDTNHDSIQAYSGTRRFLAGYSLAGLFALWSIHETSGFKGAASCSGSLWFPGWEQYMRTHELPEDCMIYLSLGKKEERTRNAHMAVIGDVTRAYAQKLKEDPRVKASAMLWHEGGHFHEPEKRVAAGIVWLINHERM